MRNGPQLVPCSGGRLEFFQKYCRIEDVPHFLNLRLLTEPADARMYASLVYSLTVKFDVFHLSLLVTSGSITWGGRICPNFCSGCVDTQTAHELGLWTAACGSCALKEYLTCWQLGPLRYYVMRGVWNLRKPAHASVHTRNALQFWPACTLAVLLATMSSVSPNLRMSFFVLALV